AKASLSRGALGAMTLLELLAAAAPARVVAADVLLLRLDDGARRSGRRRGAAARHRERRSGAPATCSRDRFRARQRFVRVLQPAPVHTGGFLRALQPVGLL